MNIKDIYIRDPYILLFNGIYYMYSKRTLDSKEFIVYKSTDLKEWSEPKTVFTPPENFWGEKDFWAPEVHMYNGAFYMFASFKSDSVCRGTQIFRAELPDGEFMPISDGAITPSGWEALDGTLYIDKNNEPHIIFCHEWEQIADGTICEMKLSKDLRRAVSEPRVLWAASAFKGSVNAAHDQRKSLVTDGPFMFRTENGDLFCLWSTMGKNGYMECLSKSNNGDIDGEWSVLRKPLCDKNGGHGMVFRTCDGEQCVVMHEPNIHTMERAVIYNLKEEDGGLVLEKRK